MLVLTSEKLVDDFKRKHKIAGPAYPEILTDATFNKKVLESLQQTARDAGRKSFEVVKTVKLLGDEWTPENGALTAAMKLKRSAIDKRYEKEIQELFSEE
ncbi:hypothetical protein ADEAN_001053100 [Angomonas deanei]|uniref:Uncharacterized protein n=1 Tax=Angomonas deanei TaxID=59799 RepID=A0A7G2CXG1_9TRYP|nr:hypothetical protein ADEAN_001053100 [Angomonas deanei]